MPGAATQRPSHVSDPPPIADRPACHAGARLTRVASSTYYARARRCCTQVLAQSLPSYVEEEGIYVVVSGPKSKFTMLIDGGSVINVGFGACICNE